jgi:hypothetical protein
MISFDHFCAEITPQKTLKEEMSLGFLGNSLYNKPWRSGDEIENEIV